MTPEQEQAVVRVAQRLWGRKDARAALDFLVSELEAAQTLPQNQVEWMLVVKEERDRAKAAEELRDEYAERWTEVSMELHDYWFVQTSMTAGQAVKKLLSEKEAAEARVRELEEDLADWEAGQL